MKRMRRSHPAKRSAQRKANESGHTLVELVVVTTIMALLTVLITQAWRPIAHHTANLRAEATGLTELRVGLAFLRQDLGAARRVSVVNRTGLHIEREVDVLSLVGLGRPTKDQGVDYALDGEVLMREDHYTGERFAVARGISGFDVESQAHGGARMLLQTKAGKQIKSIEVLWSR